MRAIIGKIGISAATVAGIVLCIEIAFRAIHILPLDPNFNGAYTFNCYTPGTYSWLSLRTNARCLLHSTDHAFPDTVITTNSLGLRGPEIGAVSPDMRRTLFIGDSFVFGMGVADRDTLPSQFAAVAAQNGVRIQPVNAGLPTADLTYYYLYLKNSAPAVHADTVVIGFYPYNDVYDAEIQPTVTNVDAQGLPDNVISATVYVSGDGMMYSRDTPFAVSNPALRNSKTMMLALYGYRLLFPSVAHKIPLLTKQICLFRPSCHKADADIARAQKLFIAIQTLTNERHQKLLVMMIPAKFQLDDSQRFQFGIPVAFSPADLRHPNSLWAAFFQSAHIESVDLLPVFATQKLSSLYFSEDVHLNPAGLKLAADTLWHTYAAP